MTPDELDIENPASLVAYLRETRRIDAGETPAVRVLAGGVSNKTVLVERASGESWVLKQALPKLRVAADWFSDPARIHREAEALRWLPKLAPPGTITPLVFEDAGRHVLAMEAVPQPHENWKAMLLAGRVDSSHVAAFGHLLARIHSAGHERRDELASAFADRTFFETLRLEPYYAYSAAMVPSAAGFLSDLIEQTRARSLTLVHGDYSPKNVLVCHEPALRRVRRRDRVEGGPPRAPATRDHLVLLDHEVIHFGDPAFDLGFAFTHLLSKAHHLRTLQPQASDGMALSTWLMWRYYQGNLGRLPWAEDLEGWAVRHTLGCLLARVAGRSPLEYLDERERERQRDAAVDLMPDPPGTVQALVRAFMERV